MILTLWNNINLDYYREFKTGLYIETKAVGFYRDRRGVDIAKILYDTLVKYDLDTVEKATNKLPIVIESFEQSSLLYFMSKTDLPRIMLMSSHYVYDLDWISQFAHGVGPERTYMFEYDGEEFNLDQPSKFIDECHAKDLNVHPWYIQDDKLAYGNDSISETQIWVNKGVDGIFTEFPESTLSSLEYLTKSNYHPKCDCKNVVRYLNISK